MAITLPQTDMEKKAWRFALEAHKKQKRAFSGEPYFEHVRKVMSYVKQYDNKEYLAVAALLHDTVEDVKWITHEIIEKEFGKQVSDLVFELTSKDEWVDIMGKTFYLADKMYGMSQDALFIKLCDRLQNISDHYSASPKFRLKYYKETKELMESLRENRTDLQARHNRVIEQIEHTLENMNKRYFERKVLGYDQFINETVQQSITDYFMRTTDPIVDEVVGALPTRIKKKKLLYLFFRKFGSEFNRDIINDVLEIKNSKYSYDLGGDTEQMPEDLQRGFLKAMKFEMERYKDVIDTAKFFQAVLLRLSQNKELNKYEIMDKQGLI